jgi:hypothetical protein
MNFNGIEKMILGLIFWDVVAVLAVGALCSGIVYGVYKAGQAIGAW